MNNGLQPLNLDSFDAIILGVLALVLLALAAILVTMLKWLAPEVPDSDKSSLMRVGGALIVARIILLLQLMNIATFLFVKSSWQALTVWYTRIVPDQGNAVIMLMAYFIVIAVCKITWRDICRHVTAFARRTPSSNAKSAERNPLESQEHGAS